jgi:hypothetical protein
MPHVHFTSKKMHEHLKILIIIFNNNQSNIYAYNWNQDKLLQSSLIP